MSAAVERGGRDRSPVERVRLVIAVTLPRDDPVFRGCDGQEPGPWPAEVAAAWLDYASGWLTDDSATYEVVDVEQAGDRRG